MTTTFNKGDKVALTTDSRAHYFFGLDETGKAKVRLIRGSRFHDKRLRHVAAESVIAYEPKAKVNAKARTCQICGRHIHAAKGIIAHHGYTRPFEGWQTDSCEGAREQPFEVSRGALGRHIENVGLSIHNLAVRLDTLLVPGIATLSKQVPVLDENGKKVREWNQVTKRNEVRLMRLEVKPGEADYPELQLAAITKARADLKGLYDYRTFQQGRFDSWKQKEGA